MKKIKLLTGLTATATFGVAALTGCSCNNKGAEITIEGANYDKTKTKIELNKESYIYLLPPSGKDIADIKTIKVGGVALTSSQYKFEILAGPEYKLTIFADAMTSTNIYVEPKIQEQATITLDKTSLKFYPNETSTITATVTPSSSEVVWTSSDASVATVDNGVVKAIAVGTATITATVGSSSATCAVTVEETLQEQIWKTAWNEFIGTKKIKLHFDWDNWTAEGVHSSSESDLTLSQISNQEVEKIESTDATWYIKKTSTNPFYNWYSSKGQILNFSTSLMITTLQKEAYVLFNNVPFSQWTHNPDEDIFVSPDISSAGQVQKYSAKIENGHLAKFIAETKYTSSEAKQKAVYSSSEIGTAEITDFPSNLETTNIMTWDSGEAKATYSFGALTSQWPTKTYKSFAFPIKAASKKYKFTISDGTNNLTLSSYAEKDNTISFHAYSSDSLSQRTETLTAFINSVDKKSLSTSDTTLPAGWVVGDYVIFAVGITTAVEVGKTVTATIEYFEE